MRHTIDITAPDVFPSAGTHTTTLVLDRVIEWEVIHDLTRRREQFPEALGEITCIWLDTGGSLGWVYAVEKPEDFTRRYNEARDAQNAATGEERGAMDCLKFGLQHDWGTTTILDGDGTLTREKSCMRCGRFPQAEPEPELPRYLIVNIDKHQGDVTATAELSEAVLEDCAASLTPDHRPAGAARAVGHFGDAVGTKPKKQSNRHRNRGGDM